ncbi:hypothetical protein AB0K02_27270 [Streptomyces sp. NPDC049597]|uniref:hypothetical protein n=1 Tax=Streptomyces sp. NPDC049597 TaxID=3155276 RepID=UPI00344209E1
MDLAAWGAAAAPVVALLAIPATIAGVRWQVKAALKAAEATHRAGLAQAEATYRAAVETVRAGREQWRRALRRDAYAAFLTALGAAVHTAEKLAGQAEHLVGAECSNELEDVAAALYDALTVVQLEGPPPVAEAAAACFDTFREWRHTVEQAAHHYEALRRVEELREQESSNPAGRPAPATQTLALLADIDFTGEQGTAQRLERYAALLSAAGRCPGLGHGHATALATAALARRPYGTSVLLKLSDHRQELAQRREECLAAARTALEAGAADLPTPQCLRPPDSPADGCACTGARFCGAVRNR